MKKYLNFSMLFLSLVWRRFDSEIPDRIGASTAYKIAKLIWL